MTHTILASTHWRRTVPPIPGVAMTYRDGRWHYACDVASAGAAMRAGRGPNTPTPTDEQDRER